jgi:pimeloyl-ACP methyl ester carboxylesterase
MRYEGPGIGQALDRPLADQVDQRLAEHEDPHEADGIVRDRMPTAQIGDQLVHWREAESRSPGAPVLYVHGVPNASGMWQPFLERTGGYAVDLPGFGASGKRGDLDASFTALGDFVGAFADDRGLERVRLCVHDWGAVGLLWAMREPERVERLVVIDAVPFLPGYRWHVLARQWRRRGVGELAMGATIAPVARRLLPAPLVGEVLEAFDAGTQRAILRLYRSAPERALAEAGTALGAITCPALVVWGERDPYIDASFAGKYAEALGGPARVHVATGAGHWPWLDAPDIVTDASSHLVE